MQHCTSKWLPEVLKNTLILPTLNIYRALSIWHTVSITLLLIDYSRSTNSMLTSLGLPYPWSASPQYSPSLYPTFTKYLYKSSFTPTPFPPASPIYLNRSNPITYILEPSASSPASIHLSASLSYIYSSVHVPIHLSIQTSHLHFNPSIQSFIQTLVFHSSLQDKKSRQRELKYIHAYHMLAYGILVKEVYKTIFNRPSPTFTHRLHPYNYATSSTNFTYVCLRFSNRLELG